MHTVELLEQAIAEAQRRGFIVRQDWLGGSAAGACELKGSRWLLIDLALTPREQLDLVQEALQQFPTLAAASRAAQASPPPTAQRAA
jgi:hypothetical protein